MRKAITSRSRLCSKFLKKKSQECKQTYNKQRNLCVTMVRKAMKNGHLKNSVSASASASASVSAFKYKYCFFKTFRVKIRFYTFVVKPINNVQYVFVQRLVATFNFTEALDIWLCVLIWISLKCLDLVNNIVPKVLLTCNLIFVCLYSLTLSVDGHSLSKIGSPCKM